MRIVHRLLVAVTVGFSFACATVSPNGSGEGGVRNANEANESNDAWALFDDACAVGSSVHSVKGSVWLKVHSRDASGQFPALVDAHPPDSLTLEVTNLIGATQAVIAISGAHYTITAPDSSKPGGVATQEGRDAWGGIPLRWAMDLFVGRVPCPSAASVKAGANISVAAGVLTVETRSSGEKFIYQFRTWGGKAWPEALHWEQSSFGRNVSVDFKFDDPEDATGSPRKWEAKSGQGEIKARWRERKVGT